MARRTNQAPPLLLLLLLRLGLSLPLSTRLYVRLLLLPPQQARIELEKQFLIEEQQTRTDPVAPDDTELTSSSEPQYFQQTMQEMQSTKPTIANTYM